MYKSEEDMKWTIGRARQQFSRLVRSATRRPQAIYNRKKLVAGVVDGETFEALTRVQEHEPVRSVAEAFEELRALCAEEGYELSLPGRADRPNPFAPGDEG
jgi:hypothetical protein